MTTTTPTKKLKTAGEIDSYCTKCKLDLNHRVVAMVDGQPKRVECSTCSSQHNYRKPKSAAAAAKPKRDPAAPKSTRGKGSVSARALAAFEAENEREKAWEKAVSGRAVSDFKSYRVSVGFSDGELMRHAKFGDGIVLRIIEKTKIEVMFKDGPKILAHGMEA